MLSKQVFEKRFVRGADDDEDAPGTQLPDVGLGELGHPAVAVQVAGGAGPAQPLE